MDDREENNDGEAGGVVERPNNLTPDEDSNIEELDNKVDVGLFIKFCL